MYFRICDCCGSFLDPGEICDCRETDENKSDKNLNDECEEKRYDPES